MELRFLAKPLLYEGRKSKKSFLSENGSLSISELEPNPMDFGLWAILLLTTKSRVDGTSKEIFDLGLFDIPK